MPPKTGRDRPAGHPSSARRQPNGPLANNEYIKRALQGVVHCLDDGLDVRGYTYWSAFDNFEWMLGYRPTFGLIAVDRFLRLVSNPLR